ncbi:MAG: oligosaccharide flippase family protein, partial [Muribaculaceae bacterium]|nr:oligosaccharide flippase family protein [Muribaculaceae bacterium]
GLFAGAIVGISLALGGYGAWAIVWQTVTLNGIKSLVLWLTSGWRPLWRFSAASLRSFFAVGWGMMGTSFLNTLFQNIYSFVIGNRAGLAPLGYYSQADKWSKMGITSISQVLTSSFLPALSEVQDDPERFSRISARMNRFTSYLLFPAMGFLALLAEPIFHCLFGEKWDASIILFQLLLVRGVFTVLSSLYNNYAVAVARTKLVMAMEALRDGAAFALLAATLPFIADTRPGDPVWGIRLMLYGQLAASALSWAVMTVKTAPLTGRHIRSFLSDSIPYLTLTLGIMAVAWIERAWIENPWLLLIAQGSTALTLYLAANHLLGSAIQREVFAQLRRR